MSILDPNCIDDAAVQFFTTGQCLVLAAVMSEDLGNPVFQVYADKRPRHAVVCIAEGLWADIEGIHTSQEIFDNWDATDICPFVQSHYARDAAKDFYLYKTAIRPQWEVAEQFIAAVAIYWDYLLQQVA